jgi:hypothetical protein
VATPRRPLNALNIWVLAMIIVLLIIMVGVLYIYVGWRAQAP